MALIIKLQINHNVITVISAQRVETDVVKGVNRYKITSIDYREDMYGGEVILHGYILHTYAHPAEVLAQKAITKVLETTYE